MGKFIFYQSLTHDWLTDESTGWDWCLSVCMSCGCASPCVCESENFSVTFFLMQNVCSVNSLTLCIFFLPVPTDPLFFKLRGGRAEIIVYESLSLWQLKSCFGNCRLGVCVCVCVSTQVVGFLPSIFNRQMWVQHQCFNTFLKGQMEFRLCVSGEV